MANRRLLTQEEVQDIYDKRARIYDLTVWFYYLADMRIGRRGRMVVEALALMQRHVWESVERHLENTGMQELYGGFVYIISGAAPSSPK